MLQIPSPFLIRFLPLPSVQILRESSLSSKAWLERKKKDPYVEFARRECYRCRSAFKLLEVDDRLKMIKPGLKVIDLGASPGSWTQVLVKRTNSNGDDKNQPKGFVIAVDINGIQPLPGAIILGFKDFTKSSTQEEILKIMGNEKFDLVCSDMAPKATGVACLDKENSSTLSRKAFEFAIANSKKNASCIIKVLEGGFVPKLVEDMKLSYNAVKIVRPKATQTESSEQFLVGREFKGEVNNVVK